MRVTSILFVIFAIILFLTSPPSITLPQETPPTWQVYFSPHGGCTESIIRELNKAKNTVLVQAYPFISASIAEAILNAHKEGYFS